MADTGTVTVTRKQDGKLHMEHIAWTAVGGVAELAVSTSINGLLLMLETVPGTVTTSYDVTIENEDSTDVLQGVGSGRSTSAAECVAVELSNGQPAPCFTGSYTFKIANATGTDDGVVKLYWEERD